MIEQQTPTPPPLLDVREVSRKFGGFTAVDSVSLAVSTGEILGIAGPNGAGKSTLFNLISGVPFGPSSGSVHFNDVRIDRSPADRISRQGLRRTFQAEQLFSTLTVRENVSVSAAYLARSRPSTRVVRRETNDALERAGIAHYADSVAAEVPVLVKKKIMIASALVAAPELLMLDEPAGGLDEDDQADLIDLLRQLNGEGLTLLIIEHVLSLLRDLAGRMIIMSSGRILTQGLPEQVLAEPAVIEAYLGVSA